MEKIKTFLAYLFNPFHKFGSRGLADKVVKYVNKKNFINYLVAFLITVLIVVFAYFIEF